MFLRQLIVFLSVMIVASIGYTPGATAKYRISIPLTDSVLEAVPTEPPVVLAKAGKRPQAQFKQAAKKPVKRTKPTATLKKPIGPTAKKRSVSALPKATLPTGRVSVSQAARKRFGDRVKSSSSSLAANKLNADKYQAKLSNFRSKKQGAALKSSVSKSYKAATSKGLKAVVDKRFIKTSDPFSIQGKIKGDAKAWVRAEVKGKHINVTDIYRGNLPSKSAGILLAKTLKSHGVSPKSITMSNIVEPRTMAAFRNGQRASNSTLGRTAQNALQIMGLRSKNMTFRKENGKLFIDINIR